MANPHGPDIQERLPPNGDKKEVPLSIPKTEKDTLTDAGERVFSRFEEKIGPDTTGYSKEAYNAFKQQFIKLPQDIQSKISDAIINKTDNFLSQISEMGSYPLDEEGVKKLLKLLNISSESLAETEVKSKFEWVAKIDKNLILRHPRGQEFVKILESKDKNNNEIIKEILNLLGEISNDEKSFSQFLDLVRQSDTAKGLSGSESVYAMLRSTSQGTPLAAKFELYESRKPLQAQESLPTSDNARVALAVGDGTNLKKSGDMVQATSPNGDTIRFDLQTGKREIGRGNYFLETDKIGSAAFAKETLAYQTKKNALEADTSRLEKVKAFFQENKNSFPETTVLTPQMKEEIKKNIGGNMYESLNIENISNVGECIKKIDTKLQDIATQSEVLRGEYQNALAQAIGKEKNQREQKEKVTKDILDFLQKIGFTLLPKKDTDSIIQELQSGGIPNIVIGGKSFTKLINIKEGSLGINNSKPLLQSDEEEFFLKFFNKMISGDENKPLTYGGSRQNIKFNGGTFDSGALDAYIKYTSGVYQQGGFNRTQVLQNLRTTKK